MKQREKMPMFFSHRRDSVWFSFVLFFLRQRSAMERALSSMLIAVLLIVPILCHPTTYKLNDNLKLEPDLVPVSSTVIPLPVYKVAYTLGTLPTLSDEKVTKPEGPISLITVHNSGGSKKVVPTQKAKKHQQDYTSVKQISKKEFDD